MKTLHYRRHSLRDGLYISAHGLQVARAEGAEFNCAGEKDVKIFHGGLIRTAQTAAAFITGLAENAVPAWLMPVVEEIGTQAAIDKMVNDAMKAEMAKGLPYFECLKRAYTSDQVVDFAADALVTVTKMFDQLEQGDFAVAFGHSPMIELAAIGFTDLPDGWDEIRELDGIVFEQYEDGEIMVIEVTRADRPDR